MQKRFDSVKVSVIMPAYQAQDYIVQAMDSVLGQTLDDRIELLIVDDCSKDRTAQIVKKYMEEHGKEDRHGIEKDRSIRLISNPRNLGVAQSRNRAVAEARGEYVAFLDADDWWDTAKLQKQLALCEREEKPVLCYTGRELMRPDGSALGKVIEVPERADYNMLLRTNHIPCSSVLLKTEAAREFPMCHDELHEDYIMWLQITKKYGEAIGINEPLLKSRLSEGGKSRNKWKSAKMQYGVYRYLGFSPIAAFFYMGCYMINGIRKYS
ncbi:MAG: glycosyltransferase family 2 protein [Eubacterium sp.]|jgi:Glycosyltransferases involved in cell wall biogenesis|nr:glycosyltransferase family 2 protein [Eubacterium sp.]